MDTQIKKRTIPFKEFKAKVKELGGWIEGEVARFPSTGGAHEFQKWIDNYKAKS